MLQLLRRGVGLFRKNVARAKREHVAAHGPKGPTQERPALQLEARGGALPSAAPTCRSRGPTPPNANPRHLHREQVGRAGVQQGAQRVLPCMPVPATSDTTDVILSCRISLRSRRSWAPMNTCGWHRRSLVCSKLQTRCQPFGHKPVSFPAPHLPPHLH